MKQSKRIHTLTGQILFSLALALCLTAPLGAQTPTTAADFFRQMQEKYGSISDYEAKVSISAGKSPMSGVIVYKTPKLLRIDFDQPANQVISFNGEELTVYLPEYAAILVQSVSSGGAAGASVASAQGLAILGRNYSIAYDSSHLPLPLDEGSSEQVIKLALVATRSGEGYRRIVLSVNPDTKLIRRMDGTAVSGARFVFDFTGIKLNQNIPDARFLYDSPASANLYNNFLFKSE